MNDKFEEQIERIEKAITKKVHAEDFALFEEMLTDILTENERVAVMNETHPPIERCQTWNVGQMIRQKREELAKVIQEE